MIVTYTKKGLNGDLVIVAETELLPKWWNEQGYNRKDFIRKDFDLHAEIFPCYTDHEEFHLVAQGE